MSKREAVIQAMARAMWEYTHLMPWDCAPVVERKRLGAINNALDAALSVLSEPDERMVEAAVKAGDDYYLGDNIVWDEIPVMFTAMLSTLRSPEK